MIESLMKHRNTEVYMNGIVACYAYFSHFIFPIQCLSLSLLGPYSFTKFFSTLFHLAHL